MLARYNEIEPFAAEWVRNLIDAGHIEPGEVVQCDIRELKPEQCGARFHAFAGIGVWSYALRLAGVPDDAPVWTGSCPCQPFSTAGRSKGANDARHLWPAWLPLIRECRPAVIFGEQVASADGRLWLDAVSADLETLGYAVAAADLCAAGIGAPHIRQRLFWVAFADAQRREGLGLQLLAGQSRSTSAETSRRGEVGGLADAAAPRSQGYTGPGSEAGHQLRGAGSTDGLGDTCGARSGRNGRAVSRTQAQSGSERFAARRFPDELVPAGATSGFWRSAEWWLCRDPNGPRARPAEPGTFPLVDGATSRVGRLRAYGNAIVAPLAATFIRAALKAQLR